METLESGHLKPSSLGSDDTNTMTMMKNIKKI